MRGRGLVLVAGCAALATLMASCATPVEVPREAAPLGVMSDICAAMGETPDILDVTFPSPMGNEQSFLFQKPGESGCSLIFEPSVRAEAFYFDGRSTLVVVESGVSDTGVLQAWVSIDGGGRQRVAFPAVGDTWESRVGPTVITRDDAGSRPGLRVTVG